MVQWYINGFGKNIEELKILAEEMNPTTIWLQETNFKVGKSMTFGGRGSMLKN
jgi:hypothetical protein